MDLKEFISSAICDIAEGVAEADKKIEPMGGLANPGTHLHDGSGDVEFVSPRTTLNFDIAVSASTSGEAGGKAAARIWVVEAALDGKKTSANETVSRLTFSVDVVFPSDRDQTKRVGKVTRPPK